MKWPIAVAARSKAGAGRLLGLRFRIPPWALTSVCCECVLSGGGLCDGPFLRPESYQVCVCVFVT